MKDMKFVDDVMVRNPQVAHPWQLVYHVRKTMLETSYSYLPVLVGEGSTPAKWQLISDHAVMHFLRCQGREKGRALTVEQAIEMEEGLKLEPGDRSCKKEDLIKKVLKRVSESPLLVLDSEHPTRLVGLLTAFDLL